MKTIIQKSRMFGWEAETTIKLTEERYFILSTRRIHTGNLVSSARSVKLEGNFTVSSSDDWFERIRDAGKVRLTEKTVRYEHSAALDEPKLQSLLERCKKHYGIE